MLTIRPSRHGRAGDLIVATSPAPLAASTLDRPAKSFLGQPVYDLGLGLDECDLAQLRAAALDAFKAAFPEADGSPRLPIRPAQGRPLLWVETLKAPVCVDAADQPIDPPVVGTSIKLLFRLCPYSRQPNRHGVGAYLIKLKLAP